MKTPAEIRTAIEHARQMFDDAILTPNDGDRILDAMLAILELIEKCHDEAQPQTTDAAREG